MMSSAANYKGKHRPDRDKFRFLANTVSIFFGLACMAILTILSIHFLFDNTNMFNPTNASIRSAEIGSCDLFKGRWIRDSNPPLYTNSSCATTAPWLKSCLLLNGNDTDYLNWKWKPDRCELPPFNAVTFLSILQGKKMAFIGDSLARNQAESLVCILSTVEVPYSDLKYSDLKSKEDRQEIITWEFRQHNFTMTVFWSPFLVAATGIAGTNGFDIHLDRVDAEWLEKFPSVDYAVFSSSHWFMRDNYMYEEGRVVGCIQCDKPNTTAFWPGQAIRMAFRTALRAVNGCESCKRTVSFVRTYSPEHFENGSWNSGGKCNQTRPVEREDLNPARPDSGYRKVQVEEVEIARIEGQEKGNEFEILDITEMTAMRVDAHPGRFVDWNRVRDCLHWCLPGPTDTWNELLLESLKRLDS